MKKTLFLTLGLVLVFMMLVTPTLGPASQARDASAGQHVPAVPVRTLAGSGDGGELTWVERTPASAPTARGEAAMVYDIARGVTVLFGGRTPDDMNDTWEWGGVDWVQRTPQNAPSPRYGHAMAYDAGRGVTVLFGGGSHLDDTWEWDGMDWAQRTPATSPSGRVAHMMAYDAARGVTVLFGGHQYDGAHIWLNDTWEWDGVDWVQRTPATTPPGRAHAAMAYDAARGVTVLFGGWAGFYGDTWEWDGTDWAQRSPATAPTARLFPRMVYDAEREVCVLFGGYDYTYNYQNDTWEWDGTNWVQRTPAASPTGRDSHQMAYDAARGLTFLFGGGGVAGFLGDTWEYPIVTGWTVYVPVVLHAYPPGP